jgi:hypothetical protein
MRTNGTSKVRQWCAAAVLAVGVAAGLSATAVPASAATPAAVPKTVPTTFCNGKSANTVVAVYHRGSGAYPLRCGGSSWGFVHLLKGHAWNATVNSEIANVIARGYYDAGVFNWRLCPNFRVPYNGGALNGTGVRPQGIITAYHSWS